MTIEFYITEKDYINFNLFHLYHSKSIKLFLSIIRYGVPVIVLLWNLFWVIIENSGFLVLVPYCVLMILWIIFIPKLTESINKSTVRKQIREGKRNDFIGWQRITLHEDYIGEAAVNITSNINYEAIERIGQGYGCIYIYIGAIKSFIIPLSAFTDINHKIMFMNFIEHKTGIKIPE